MKTNLKALLFILFFIICGTISLFLDKETFVFKIPEELILQLRFSKILSAVFCGIALPISGFLLQEIFKNPLAGPSVLGISTSASVGVAVFVFLGNHIFLWHLFSDYALVISALSGSGLCILLLLWINSSLQDNNTFIIVGFLISALAGTIVSFLQFISPSETVKQYIVWNLGSFTGLDATKNIIFSVGIAIGMFFSVLSIHQLRANLLGEKYAISLGISLQKMKLYILIATGILTGITTAFLGPIAFIGIIIPHFSRMTTKTSNLYQQFVFTILIGISTMLFINVINDFFTIPINILASIIGVPVILYVMLKKK